MNESLSEVKYVLKFISHIIEKPTEAVTRTKLENYKFNEELIKERISLLHCTSQYPTPISKINLNNIKTLKKIYIGSIGLSDHSEGYLAAVAGVGMGIEILEKHFTLSQKMQGPDHKASMEPAEFSQLVTLVRDAYKALGKHSKELLDIEQDVAKVAKKSIVASKKIGKGDKFTEANLTVKRPGTGVSAKFFFDYLGKMSTHNYEKDDFIENNLFLIGGGRHALSVLEVLEEIS